MDISRVDHGTSTSNITTSVNPVMHAISSFVLLGTYAVQAVLGRPNSLARRANVDSFIEVERPIALQGVLRNIGSDGALVRGAGPGVVIASPSTVDPDYFYTWTRDSALVLKCLTDIFANKYDAGLQSTITQYITTQAQVQRIDNPSGPLSDGSGLGEPKYNANLSPYLGSWGRPQRDGPALRATALVAYANWLIGNNYTSTARDIVWPILRNDLNYVAQYWNRTGFDLWEEVQGSSFFTTGAQYKALIEGDALAKKLGATCSSCESIAPNILCFLQSFWTPNGNYIVSNTNTGTNRSGKDANSILSSIHSFDPAAGCDELTFQPCSAKSLANHKAVVDSFRFYPINSGIQVGRGLAVGRYSEDVYYGGNPWHLTTLAAAEQIYDAVYVWKKQGRLEVTNVSLPFFRDLSSSVAVGSYASDSTTFTQIIDAALVYADGFIEVVQRYAGANGSLDEQIDKNNGSQRSARDLTWSYAAFLTATDRRAGVVPPSWFVPASLPGSCSTGSQQGVYSAVTPASFPASQTPITGAPPVPPTTTAPPGGCTTAPVVAVTFNVLVTTTPGDTIKIVGDIEDLGKWNPQNGIALDANDYTASRPLWKKAITLKAGQVVQYKFINVASGGAVRWEADPNRVYTVPSSCATAVAVDGQWQT
ncbi:hypothetical protein MCOR14_007737 [Pyricularia oryzae]|nr:hypothetical protein MCOR14_007737 [Pyricularia oryzae]